MKKNTAESTKKPRRKKFNKDAYNRTYNKDHQVRKQMYFNRNIPADVELLAWVRRHKNFTKYIKSLIRKDMEAHGAAELAEGVVKNQTSFLPQMTDEAKE